MVLVKPVKPRETWEKILNSIPELRAFTSFVSWYLGKIDFSSIHISRPQSLNYLFTSTTRLTRKYSSTCLKPYIVHLKSLVSLRNLWILAHMATISGTLTQTYSSFYGMNYTTGYNLASYSTMLTYALVVYRHTLLLSRQWSSSNSPELPFSTVLRSENTHLLVMAILVATSEPNILKLCSFSIYSFMNLSDLLSRDIFKNTQVMVAAGPLLNCLEYPLLIIAAKADIAVVAIYLRESIATGHMYKFLLYIFVFGLRMESSESCRIAFHNALMLIHAGLVKANAPLSVLDNWIRFEEFCNIFVPSLVQLSALAKEGNQKIENELDESDENEEVDVIEVETGIDIYKDELESIESSESEEFEYIFDIISE
ncbi:hypothetical protein CAAN1_07S00144 [[Candida] anglica]|uniref:Uncharacterized protein n=1 Tax=[Candida] anglica TaxID=148631 RepID=A0ABP0EAS2_9ASCO